MSESKVEINDEELCEKIEEFRRWIRTQPQLPQNIGRHFKRESPMQLKKINSIKYSELKIKIQFFIEVPFLS